MKFEPGDLMGIPVPDLRRVSAKTLDELCAAFDALVDEDSVHTREAMNTCVVAAAAEAVT